ncbi:DUF2291 family protein [Nakamurella alba]|uniref:DUF2291 family protein n=1 Tax=Nakamurella alba TaxID=2665158 RepID=UPI0018AB5010|nr:DUF2291 domain-containing protein [Nakamurella alba]
MAAILLLALVALTGCSVPGLWHYEAEGSGTGAGGTGAFDAAAYVDGIWADKVLPTVSEKAVDAAVLLPALVADKDAAVEQYGVKSAATGGSPSFLVKGSGPVTGVDTENPNGPITVKIGDTELQVVTGPVIIGTALRDAVGFINFSDFVNQIDYQNVGTQLNNKVKTEVVPAVKDQDLTGKTLTFEGAFTLLSPTSIQVVPTKLTVS